MAMNELFRWSDGTHDLLPQREPLMAMKEPAACDRCGEHHEYEADCPNPDIEVWDAGAWRRATGAD